MRPVDIVIPIHDARDLTLRCIESVLAHATGEYRLVLADDASKDPELIRFLDAVAAREPRAVLLRGERNLGFVGTCNAAMEHARGRDVLLLNSDTVVTAGFLDRIRACVYELPDTGIACPLSNNATILSVPRFCADNPLPHGHTIDSFAELIARASPRLRTPIVTAVGFCMYVRAEVIERIGVFDLENFGRGYGEENDFCERALAAGFRIRVADDAFVYHAGGGSFGAEATERQKAGAAAMQRLHPRYFTDVAHFIEANPLRKTHAAIDLGLERRHADVPALLVVVHASLDRPAGGTEHHVRELIETVRLPRVIVATPEASGLRLHEVFDGDLAGALAYRVELAAGASRFERSSTEVCAALERVCRVFGVGAAHVHHLLYWPLDLWRAFDAVGIPYALTTHDFYTLCPSHNLVNSATGGPCCLDPAQTEDMRRRCVEDLFHHLGMPLGEPALAFRDDHRREASRLIDHAHALVFPSEAARAIVASRVPSLPPASRVVPHGYPTPPLDPRQARGPALQIAFLGEVAYKTKGATQVLELLGRCRDLDVVWHVFGGVDTFGYRKELEQLGLGDRLVLHGPYRREQIRSLLREHGIDLAVLLPTWPETFSFTVSEALTAEIPLLVKNIGAPADRVAESGAGFLVAGVDEAVAKLSELVRDPAGLAPARAAAERFRHRSLEEMAEDYRQLYAELLPAERRPTPASLEDARALLDFRLAAVDPAGAIQQRAHPRVPWLAHPIVRGIARLAIPASLRRRFRHKLVEGATSAPPRGVVRSMPLDEARETDGLTRLGSWRRHARYQASGRDPRMLLAVGAPPLEVADVQAIEFDLLSRCDDERRAQIFWTHEEGENFSEEKSIVVPLESDGAWRTYTVEILRTDKLEAWRAGRQLRALRFDPLDGPGVVAVGSLRFLS